MPATNELVSQGGSFNPLATPIAAREAVTYVPSNGPFAIATGIVVFRKGSAAAAILRSPTAAEEGTVMTFTAGSAFAHVLTGSFQDGVTGGAKTTATFGAFVGASLTLMAVNKAWYVRSLNVCVLT